MSKNTSIALGDRHIAYAQRKVGSGQFASVSEVVRDALRRAEERDARLEALDKAIQEGLDSGIDHNFDLKRWIDDEFPESECRAGE